METITHSPTSPAVVPPTAGPQASKTDWIGGALISVLFPLIGAIVGLVYVAKGGAKRQVGLMCLVLSVIAFAVFFTVMNA